MVAISLQQISKVFPGANTPSVDELNLDIQQGEFLCILGPSGCGKSTTLRMIAGLETLTDGVITISGREVDNVGKGIHVPSEQRELGMVFQSYALWPHMSVEDNVAFGPKMQKRSRGEVADLVDSALKKLGLDGYRTRYPSELSGGQQQRVAIARMLAAQPDVLLLDEPLSNLDARLRLEMRAEFQRIHQETGSTIVFVTHDQWEAMTLATRIAVMHEGRLQQLGAPMEIYAQPANRFVAEFLGSPPINIVTQESKGQLRAALSEWVRSHSEEVTSVGIRPENVRVSHSEENLPVDSVKVQLPIRSVMPTGGNWIIELEDETGHWYATSTVTPNFSAGDTVTIWADKKDILLFDSADNRIPVERIMS